jgi:hypothetical protein
MSVVRGPVYSILSHSFVHQAVRSAFLVDTARRVRRLLTEIWRGAASVLNKQSRTNVEEWSSSFAVGYEATVKSASY